MQDIQAFVVFAGKPSNPKQQQKNLKFHMYLCPAVSPPIDSVVLEDMYVNVQHGYKHCHVHLTF